MNSKLRVFEFVSGAKFALAKDVEDYAASKGWRVKVDCDGHRHPGTICNEHIKRIISKNDLRRHFNWHSTDVVSADIKDIVNYPILSDLIEKEIISYSTIKNGYLDLYNLNAVRMIISCMIQDVEFQIPDEDIVVDSSYELLTIHYYPHKWDTKKLKTHTLFKVKPKEVKPRELKPVDVAMKSFLESNFTEEEKAAIRKYQRLIRETRQNGTRPYIKRNNSKEDKNNG